MNLQFTTPGRCGTNLACGQTVGGGIVGRAQQDAYRFSGNAGEAVSIAGVLTSGTLAARVELYGRTEPATSVSLQWGLAGDTPVPSDSTATARATSPSTGLPPPRGSS